MKKTLLFFSGALLLTTATASQFYASASPESFDQQEISQMKQHYITTLNWMEEHCGKDMTSKYANCGYNPANAGCRAQAYQNCKSAISPTKININNQQ